MGETSNDRNIDKIETDRQTDLVGLDTRESNALVLQYFTYEIHYPSLITCPKQRVTAASNEVRWVADIFDG